MTRISRRVPKEGFTISAEDIAVIRAGLDLLAFYGSRDVACRAVALKERFKVV